MFKLCTKCSAGVRISNLDQTQKLDKEKIKQGFKLKTICPVCGFTEYLKEKVKTGFSENPYE